MPIQRLSSLERMSDQQHLLIELVSCSLFINLFIKMDVCKEGTSQIYHLILEDVNIRRGSAAVHVTI